MSNIYNSQLDAFTLYHKVNNTSTSSESSALPALGHAISGSTGTAISNLLIYPLDLVITRLQVQRSLKSTNPSSRNYDGILDAFHKIYTEEGGLRGFYAGVIQDTGKSIADSFLFFLFYGYIRTKRLERSGTKGGALPILEELSVGALAGAVAKFFTTPLANIVVRKQTYSMLHRETRKQPSLMALANSILTEKGIAGFWSGYSASLILTLNPSLTFFFHEALKKVLGEEGGWTTFLLAAGSKAMASSITYPFSLAKTRAQTSSTPPVDPEAIEMLEKDVEEMAENGIDVSKGKRKEAERHLKSVSAQARRSTVFTEISKIYRNEGMGGLYEGITGEIIKGFLGHGLTMIVKERVHSLVLAAYFYILKLLKKGPSAGELASQANEKLQDGVDTARESAGSALESGRENAGSAFESVRGGAESAMEATKQRTESAYESAKAGADAALESAREMQGKVMEGAKDLGERIGVDVSGARQKAAEAGERAAVVGNNATEAAKSVQGLASEEAGHLLGNAAQQLGGGVKGKEDE